MDRKSNNKFVDVKGIEIEFKFFFFLISKSTQNNRGIGVVVGG